MRTVTLNNRIAMGRYEVSFADYDRFVDAVADRSRPGDQGWGRGTRPVIYVRLSDAQAYATWLSTQTGKTYRLPSEAEWEYAARAGTTTAYSFGASITCSQANYARNLGGSCNTGRDNALARSVAVGSFTANAFGLYDMHGNVWEWVDDCWQSNYEGAPTDGSARTCLIPRIMQRGGSWSSAVQLLRSAYRQPSVLIRSADLGFRLVRELSP